VSNATSQEKAQAPALYNSGEILQSVGEQFKRSPSCIADWVRSAGYRPRRTRNNVGKNNPRYVDIAGRSFGRWSVVQFAGSRRWLCECQCERRTLQLITSSDLTAGKSRSCGCIQDEGLCIYRSERTTTITKHQHEIIEGLLMSDAGLYKSPSGSVRMQFGSEWVSFTAHVAQVLPFDFGTYTRPAYTKRIAGNPKPSRCKPFHTIASPVDRSLLSYDVRWYDRVPGGRGVKHVPSNIELTPTMLLYWFLGDGSTRWLKQETPTTGSCVQLRFHTNSFADEDVQTLIVQLASSCRGMRFIIERSAQGHPIISSSTSDAVRAFFAVLPRLNMIWDTSGREGPNGPETDSLWGTTSQRSTIWENP
jgi:LAGLIDADG DNA endonuclease family